MKIFNRLLKKPSAIENKQILDDSIQIKKRTVSQSGNHPEGWELLEKELKEIPALGEREIYWGYESATNIWWCTFQLNHKHPNVFDTIYALGHSLNNFSGSDFAGAFYPTGPYYGVNEDADECLEWMIDSFEGKDGAQKIAQDISMAMYHLRELAGLVDYE